MLFWCVENEAAFCDFETPLQMFETPFLSDEVGAGFSEVLKASRRCRPVF